MLVRSIGAVLLISDDAPSLAEFYRDVLGFPLEDEVHEGVPPHHGCELGGTHFAIHPSSDWPGRREPASQSPVVIFYVDDVRSGYERLVANGVDATPPFDHGFAVLTAFCDPDGNNIQLMTPAG